MATEKIQENLKKEFENIYTDTIKREGADKLLAYLVSTDFFEAPASTKFHSSHAGGLVEHSIKVYKRFINMLECEYGADWVKNDANRESAAVIALLHDVCKVNCYKTELRNVKKGDQWERVPYYNYSDPLPYGHGEKSVYMISGFIKLSRDEAMAINWHMGPFDARCSSNSYVLSDAFKLFPLALIFHTADMLTSYLDEET